MGYAVDLRRLVDAYQPNRPMAALPLVTYRASIITSQLKPPNKTRSRNAVSLTPAETRVLRLLTTHQTLAGIGSQLGITRSTVKTHVQNVYRKLGATKRAEAVALAESVGLLRDGGAVTASREGRTRAVRERAARVEPRESDSPVKSGGQQEPPDRLSVKKGRSRK